MENFTALFGAQADPPPPPAALGFGPGKPPPPPPPPPGGGPGPAPPPTAASAPPGSDKSAAGCGPFYLMRELPGESEARPKPANQIAARWGWAWLLDAEGGEGKPGRRVRGFRSSVSETTANSRPKARQESSGWTGNEKNGSLWPPFTLRPVSEADGGFMIP